MGFLSGLCFCLEKRVRSAADREIEAGDREEEADEAGEPFSFFFELQALQKATDFFSESNVIGRGEYGAVYKCPWYRGSCRFLKLWLFVKESNYYWLILCWERKMFLPDLQYYYGLMPDGQLVAVKKLSLVSNPRVREFTNEVKLLLKIQHKNLVVLLGCCAGPENILVYEYFPNRSLDCILFDKKFPSLDWPERFRIVTGVARGLLYLHEEAPERIIHRDIKASNILLDDQLNPKISDFGMATLLPRKCTHMNGMEICGTCGYIPLEYASHGYLSVKTDVFSFGVLVLETVSGRRNSLFSKEGHLLTFAWTLFKQGKTLELVDPSLGEYNPDEAAMCIQLGLLCCQVSAEERPDMSSVHLMLSSDSSSTLPTPGIPPLLRIINFDDSENSISFSSIDEGPLVTQKKRMTTAEPFSIFFEPQALQKATDFFAESNMISSGRSGDVYKQKSGPLATERKRLTAAEPFSFFFELQVLQKATDFFSESNIIGRGRSGDVYKGLLPNGQLVAVKKLSLVSTQGLREFTNEVKLLLNIHHKNLVMLLGCCAGHEKILVYEYFPNNSLDCILFDKKFPSLDWPERFRIVTGIARGLLYLHEEAPERTIHRDIKASNILLDDQLNPKISDFGLATLFPGKCTHMNGMEICGTYGYMAPEYARHGYLSVKTDVFSFGVLVLEIVSGRRRLIIGEGDLRTSAWRLFQEGKSLELVDPSLGECNPDEAAMCIQVGLLCCQASAEERPDMSSVHFMLSSDSSSTLPTPGRPPSSSFSDIDGSENSISFSSIDEGR